MWYKSQEAKLKLKADKRECVDLIQKFISLFILGFKVNLAHEHISLFLNSRLIQEAVFQGLKCPCLGLPSYGNWHVLI